MLVVHKNLENIPVTAKQKHVVIVKRNNERQICSLVIFCRSKHDIHKVKDANVNHVGQRTGLLCIFLNT